MKSAVTVLLLACAPAATFADCQLVTVDGNSHYVCTPDQTPSGPIGFASGMLEGFKLHQQQQQLRAEQNQPPLDLREPSDTELHAAYCIGLLQDISGLWQHTVAENDAYAEQLRGQLGSSPPPPEDVATLIRKQLATLEEVKKNDLLYRRAQAALQKLQLYLLPRAPKIAPDGPLGAMTSAHSDFAASTSGNGTSHGPDPRFQACLDPSWLPF